MVNLIKNLQNLFQLEVLNMKFSNLEIRIILLLMSFTEIVVYSFNKTSFNGKELA